MMRMPGMSLAAARSTSWLSASVAAGFGIRSTRSRPNAVRVAVMLRSMYGASSDFSEGRTRSDWMSAG